MTGVESLVAFAWGCLHGDYVTYEAGAATRTQATGNLALAYAPLWDLVAWARGLGAAWFDFGGVSMGTAGDAHDPLGGIADFKRFFCNEVISVGEDWVLEPRPARAFLARAVRAAARKANL
jgi:lipid II:glycine glycyltransferase (peptidoglycan interpeptide bridge formation enzyme)